MLRNLSFQLREELREELSSLFAAGDSTVIYATTEPGEALLLAMTGRRQAAEELSGEGATTLLARI